MTWSTSHTADEAMAQRLWHSQERGQLPDKTAVDLLQRATIPQATLQLPP